MEYLYENGSSEEFRYIRGGIAFPHESTLGCFLIGGLGIGSDSIKVLKEMEFQSLSEAVQIFDELYVVYPYYRCYCRDIPENTSFVNFFTDKRYYIRPAPATEHLEFGFSLINDFFLNNRLQIPKGGILEKQLQSNFEIFEKGENLHGINALFALLSGLTSKEFIDEKTLMAIF